MNASAKKRRLENPEKDRERDRRYRRNNLEKERKRDRERCYKKYHSDPEILNRQQERLERKRLRPIIRAVVKVLRRRAALTARNRKRVVELASVGLRRLEGLRIRNPDRLKRLQQRELIERIRERIRQVLKGIKKSARTLELLGCTASEAWAHLEKQFKPGMTLENHGPIWHIDHIRPCASFDLTKPEQQRQCFHFSNLQPLFVLDNLRKGAKYDPLT